MMLQVESVSRTFGGLHAIKNVSFQLAEGEFLGLIGPNGAGKTTLFNCINGVYPPTIGSIVFRGKPIAGLPTYKVAHLGLARTHQIVRPLNELSVRENVMVGACFGRYQHTKRQARRVADEVIVMVGLAGRAEQPASSLNIAQKKRLELARALAAEPYLLLLDEVMAALNHAEMDQVLALMNRENLYRLNLEKIAFRMKDKSFFQAVTKLLRERHVYQNTLWSYAVAHNTRGTPLKNQGVLSEVNEGW